MGLYEISGTVWAVSRVSGDLRYLWVSGSGGPYGLPEALYRQAWDLLGHKAEGTVDGSGVVQRLVAAGTEVA